MSKCMRTSRWQSTTPRPRCHQGRDRLWTLGRQPRVPRSTLLATPDRHGHPTLAPLARPPQTLPRRPSHRIVALALASSRITSLRTTIEESAADHRRECSGSPPILAARASCLRHIAKGSRASRWPTSQHASCLLATIIIGTTTATTDEHRPPTSNARFRTPEGTYDSQS